MAGSAYASFVDAAGKAQRIMEYEAGAHFGELPLSTARTSTSSAPSSISPHTHTPAPSAPSHPRTAGELALLRSEPRAASVIAATDCECLRLDSGAYRRLGGSGTATRPEPRLCRIDAS